MWMQILWWGKQSSKAAEGVPIQSGFAYMGQEKKLNQDRYRPIGMNKVGWYKITYRL